MLALENCVYGRINITVIVIRVFTCIGMCVDNITRIIFGEPFTIADESRDKFWSASKGIFPQLDTLACSMHSASSKIPNGAVKPQGYGNRARLHRPTSILSMPLFVELPTLPPSYSIELKLQLTRNNHHVTKWFIGNSSSIQ